MLRDLSASATELNDLPAVAFRWPTGGRRLKLHGRFTLGCGLQPRLFAFIGLAIKRLRHRGWTADLAKQQDFNVKVAAIIGYPQLVAYADLARRLGRLPVGLNPAELAGPRSDSAGLEEPGGPKPFVHAYGRHAGIVL